jgi:hypothetical protein
MRLSSLGRSFLALSALAISGCSNALVGASSSALSADMTIEGLPASQQISVGQNVLLSLRNVSGDVESIRWFSTNPGVLSVVATPAVSPCGSACAWLRGEAAGSARVDALVCFADGACRDVRRARLNTPEGASEVEASVDVKY